MPPMSPVSLEFSAGDLVDLSREKWNDPDKVLFVSILGSKLTLW
jgi:hypothetical protein